MGRSLPLSLAYLMACAPAVSEETVVNMPQLNQLNRASQQELREIQAAPAPSERPLTPSKPWRSGSGSLDRRQQAEQSVLQESQRRELLMNKQRAKTAPGTGYPRRLDAIDQQRRFQRQQHNQLNRFRSQQGIRTR
jgi:hypothetical protein